MMEHPPRPQAMIVPATIDCLDSYRACLDSVAREGRWLALGQAPAPARARSFMQNILDGNGVQVFAVDGSTVVGWADIVRSQLEATRHVGELGMGVQSGYRGQGLGRALIEAVIEAARHLGLQRIALDVRVDNEAAIGLYAAVGFQLEGTRTATHWDGREYHDSHVMGLLRQGLVQP